jgi:hypothetical protein
LSTSLTHIYHPIIFKLGQIETAFKKLTDIIGIDENMCSLTAHLNHPNGVKEDKALNWSDLVTISEINYKALSCILLSYHPRSESSYIIYIESRCEGDLFIHCSTPNIDKTTKMVELLEQELELEIKHDRENLKDAFSDQPYIDKSRLQELKGIPTDQFDLSRLIRILEELDSSYKRNCYISIITLTRALLDHVPPIFSCKNFSEIANNYSGSKSFKESMRHLENSSRKIADQYLHTQIRQKESLPNRTQVSFSNDIDVLLSEICRVLK